MGPVADSDANPGEKTSLVEIITIGLMASTLTAIAWRAFPLWDDGLIWLLSQHGGGQAVNDSIGDRPLMAKFVQLLVDSGRWREVTALLHWLTWFGMGWVTLRLWKQFFPAHPRFGLMAACLAVTPVLCQMQTVLVTVIVPAVIGPLAVFLVVLPFLSPGVVQRTQSQLVLLWTVMVAVVAAVSMISEYPLSTVAATCVLLALCDQPQSRRTWVTIGLLIVTALGTYAAYHRLADPAARMAVRPEAQPWLFRLKWLGPRLFTDVWRLALGNFLERLGEIVIWKTKESLAGLIMGMVGALFLTWHMRRRPSFHEADDTASFGSVRTLLCLLGAITIGILPVVAMGHGANIWSSTRFWALVLPVSAILAVCLPLFLFRRQTWWTVPLACGFVSGFYLLNDGLLAVRERDRFVSMGDQLEPYVPATGLTVAVVNCTWRYPNPYPKEWELTARLTMHWPQNKREHFWAFSGMDQAYAETVQRDGKSIPVLDDPFGPRPQLLRAWREITRQLAARPSDQAAGAAASAEKKQERERQAEDITQILWVTEGPEGKIQVERLPSRQAGAARVNATLAERC